MSAAVSPGGALLRRSRMFSMPKPLPEPPSTNMLIGDHKSDTMTRRYPQHQTITSPLSSREKGDWGLKRSFPLKSTLATSTPYIRVKQLDAVENVTDFASAADHTLSLEKFQEMRIAMAVPAKTGGGRSHLGAGSSAQTDLWPKSAFEEDMDVTDFKTHGRADDKRWKFEGPWLARMTDGEFREYIDKKVRPKRGAFREMLKDRLAREMTAKRKRALVEEGRSDDEAAEKECRVTARDITDEQFLAELHSLRNERPRLFSLISRFLDLAPLGQPEGFVQSIWSAVEPSLPPPSSADSSSSIISSKATESPYGKRGPPPSHPSAGISYLRTASFMENHPVYGPQANRAPSLARVVYPRAGTAPAKLGVGGFVANPPSGDSSFNFRAQAKGPLSQRTMLNGIMFLDTTTYGGAKAYVEAQTATVDPSGKVVLQLRETTPEAQLIAKERRGGQEGIYHERATRRYEPRDEDDAESWDGRGRFDELAEEMVGEKEVMGSLSSYGLGPRR